MSAVRGAERTALVTGASGGIGYELARLCARDGNTTILVARSRERLEQFADRLRRDHGGRVEVIAADLSTPGAAGAVITEVRARGLTVDILVNNAGFTVLGRFTRTSADAERELMQLNIVTLTELTKLVLPAMVERGRGRILNLASTAAFQPGPFMAVYYASKAYVLSFSQALAEELRGSGVSVTALCPGATQSGFARRGGAEATPLFRGTLMDAQSVALAGYQGMLAGRWIVIPGLRNRVLAESVRFMPRRVVTAMVGRAQTPPG